MHWRLGQCQERLLSDILCREQESLREGRFFFWIMKIWAAQENNFWGETLRRHQSRRCEATRRRNMRMLVRESSLNWGFGQQLWRFNETLHNHSKSCLDLFLTPTPRANKHFDCFFYPETVLRNSALNLTKRPANFVNLLFTKQPFSPNRSIHGVFSVAEVFPSSCHRRGLVGVLTYKHAMRSHDNHLTFSFRILFTSHAFCLIHSRIGPHKARKNERCTSWILLSISLLAPYSQRVWLRLSIHRYTCCVYVHAYCPNVFVGITDYFFTHPPFLVESYEITFGVFLCKCGQLLWRIWLCFNQDFDKGRHTVQARQTLASSHK